MSEPWAGIVAALQSKRKLGSDAFQAGMGAVERLATMIASGPLSGTLFGWTSMHDLCVQQTDAQPYLGPYLRISPLLSGMVEFRYIDTGIVEHQWQRIVEPEAAAAQMTMFLEQLCWN
jgi:hypothetical protein